MSPLISESHAYFWFTASKQNKKEKLTFNRTRMRVRECMCVCECVCVCVYVYENILVKMHLNFKHEKVILALMLDIYFFNRILISYKHYRKTMPFLDCKIFFLYNTTRYVRKFVRSLLLFSALLMLIFILLDAQLLFN